MKARNWLKKIRFSIRDFLINRKNRSRLTNKDFTVISSDCTGGMILHDLKQRFNSPTVNMYIDASDYIKFIKNMQHYLNCEMEEIVQTEYTYPCASLDDIVLHLVHYNSVDQAREKWNERKKRINWNNMYYIMNDRNNCSKEDIDAFFNLNFNHKLFVSSKPLKEYNNTSVCFLRRYQNDSCVGIVTSYSGFIKRNYDEFDYVNWLNNR